MVAEIATPKIASCVPFAIVVSRMVPRNDAWQGPAKAKRVTAAARRGIRGLARDLAEGGKGKPR